MWKELKTIQTSKKCCSFLDAVDIWINKPHVVNRHLCGAKILWQTQCHGSIREILKQLHDATGFSGEDKILIQNITTQLLKEDIRGPTVYMRDLLPKCVDKYFVLREIVIVDNINSDAYFIAFGLLKNGEVYPIPDYRGYRVQLGKEAKSITMYVTGIQEDEIQNKLGYTLVWLQDILLGKIANWSVTSQLNTAMTSLRLVPVERYNELYQELKKKYGIPLVKVWPEKTDPQKFVFEDIAIATYLLLLWEDDRQKKGLTKKQSFVDLGCGNGLLVYILTSEGHSGLGLDLRKRKIWDFFGDQFNLKEQEVTPSSETLFPDYDWLIGNHSDELTPWIPVIAARSSFHCCYFVLPCCSHDFSAKFNQKVSGISQYRAYLDFIHEVGSVCGFQVEEDTLRIPSTKRVCFIGRMRTYQLDGEAEIDRKRQAYIEHRCSLATAKTKRSSATQITGEHQTCKEESDQLCEGDSEENVMSSSKGKWAADFQPRDSVQRSRNCLTVSTAIKDHITEVVFNKLLTMTGQESVQLADGRCWNRGGCLPLADVASMFDQETLQQLKNECGGLQTLLRNSHHIFRVQGGHVQLRYWLTDNYDEHQKNKRRKKGKPIESDQLKHTKTKLCYFYDHHPQGCPLEGDHCRFAHGQTDLRSAKVLSVTGS